MALVCLEISCAPTGDEKYPVPTTIRVARIFATRDEARHEFGDDMIYRPDPEYAGQDVYFCLWDTSEPLNIDRCRAQDNTLSNCGMWLPDTERVYGATDLEVELVPPERIRARKKQKAAVVTGAEADMPGEYVPSTARTGGIDTTGAGRLGRRPPWKTYM